MAFNKNFHVQKNSVLGNAGQRLTQFHVGAGSDAIQFKNCEMFSLQLETMSTSVGHLKYVMRACLTNQDGDRLLDTLIAPPEMPKGVTITQPKEGIKKRMIGLAKEIGPSIKDVSHVICHFVKGKMLTGYHVPMKL